MSALPPADDSALAAVRDGRPFAAIDLGTTYAKSVIAQLGPASAWNTAGAASVCYTSRQVADGAAQHSDRGAAGGESLRLAHERAIVLSGRAPVVSACVAAVPMSAVALRCGRADVVRQRPTQPVEADEAAAVMRQAAVSGLHRDSAVRQEAWLGPVWTRWTVDDRAVTSPVGFRAARIAAEVTHAFAPAEPVGGIADWGEHQGLATLALPEVLAFAELLRHRRPGVVLDAGGQRSDLYVRTAAGHLHWHGVALGGHYFTRMLCAGAALSPARAEKVKLAYAEGRLRARSRMRVGAMMRRAAGVWCARVGEAVAALPEPVPGLWLLCGGHARLPECGRLPGALADASMTRLESYPSLEPLTYGEAGLPLTPGPETLLPSHAVCFGLAQWVVRLARDEHSLSHLRRLALAAAREGYEVSSVWLTL
ncbi:MAG: hypothetical protein ACYC5O_08505 [Anaerolineae bacterium]